MCTFYHFPTAWRTGTGRGPRRRAVFSKGRDVIVTSRVVPYCKNSDVGKHFGTKRSSTKWRGFQMAMAVGLRNMAVHDIRHRHRSRRHYRNGRLPSQVNICSTFCTPRLGSYFVFRTKKIIWSSDATLHLGNVPTS